MVGKLYPGVLSARRRRKRHLGVARWLAFQRTSDLYLGAVTVGEVERGIVQKQRRNPSVAHDLSVWLEHVLTWYADWVLAIDAPTARRLGQLSSVLGYESANQLIAATAPEHGLTGVTHNAHHFESTGVPALDPFTPNGVHV